MKHQWTHDRKSCFLTLRKQIVQVWKQAVTQFHKFAVNIDRLLPELPRLLINASVGRMVSEQWRKCSDLYPAA